MGPNLNGARRQYDDVAIGRPIIAVTAKNGEIANVVTEYNCGVVVEPGHSDQLARVITDLSSNVTTREIMGQRSRAMLEANFTRQHAFQNWGRVVDRVGRQQKANE